MILCVHVECVCVCGECVSVGAVTLCGGECVSVGW